MRSESTNVGVDTYRNGNYRRNSGNLLNDIGRSGTSLSETATDDSFSVTSGFGGHRTTTVETSLTTSGSLLDGRPMFRRPLGCAVLELPGLAKLTSGGDGGGLEYNMPIYVPVEEAGFAGLHEDIIEKRSRAYIKSSKWVIYCY
jgi:dedicator of cytokinesis protein 3